MFRSVTKTCKRCGRPFEFCEHDAGKWEDYCHRCEKTLEKEEEACSESSPKKDTTG